MITVTKEFHWEMAHILTNHQGLCGNLHGHSYKMLVTLTSNNLGEAGDAGMVMDFTRLKKIISKEIDEKWDHSFAYNTNSDDLFEIEIAKVVKSHQKRIIELDYRTTAENMSEWWFKFVNARLNELFPTSTIRCSKVQLFETVSGSATFEGEKND